MTTLLKRLSMNLERRVHNSLGDDASGPTRGMASTHSFNDFSMHINQEVDDHMDHHSSDTRPVAMPEMPTRAPPRASPFAVGSAPASMAPITTKALRIPRTSVASILMREPSSTPRSSLDLAATSLPSPRHSMADEPGSPKSPRSPTTPGGRRRKQQKIHGMDYYEFCELVRAGSLWTGFAKR